MIDLDLELDLELELAMLLAFACPELHLGAVRLLGHGQLVDLQVDLANLEDPALG